MTTNIDPEMLYMKIGLLIKDMPDLHFLNEVNSETSKWLWDSYAIVKVLEDAEDAKDLKEKIGKLTFNIEYKEICDPLSYDLTLEYQREYARDIQNILYMTFAVAELNAPISSQGSFIFAGESGAAFMAISKLLNKAKSEILIVDPYLDKIIFTKYMEAISNNVNIKLIASKKNNDIDTLNQNFEQWVKKNNSKRPTELRIAGKNVLHDRLVIIDNEEVYILTQSFNAFAEKSPATIVRFPAIDLKLGAYKDIWNDAEPIKP